MSGLWQRAGKPSALPPKADALSQKADIAEENLLSEAKRLSVTDERDPSLLCMRHKVPVHPA